MRDRVFVTGTDTGVGKTVVSAAIAIAASRQGKRVGYLKPAQTGGDDDADFVARAVVAAGFEVETRTPYRFEEALAPSVAAERAAVRLELDVVLEAYEELRSVSDLVVVEGAGGVLVPFAGSPEDDEILMVDLAAKLGSPVVVVARPGLGTLNHTRLTVEACQGKVPVEGIVISGWPESPGTVEILNREMIARFAGAPLLGVIPFVPGLDTEGPTVGDWRGLVISDD